MIPPFSDADADSLAFDSIGGERATEVITTYADADGRMVEVLGDSLPLPQKDHGRPTGSLKRLQGALFESEQRRTEVVNIVASRDYGDAAELATIRRQRFDAIASADPRMNRTHVHEGPEVDYERDRSLYVNGGLNFDYRRVHKKHIAPTNRDLKAREPVRVEPAAVVKPAERVRSTPAVRRKDVRCRALSGSHLDVAKQYVGAVSLKAPRKAAAAPLRPSRDTGAAARPHVTLRAAKPRHNILAFAERIIGPKLAAAVHLGSRDAATVTRACMPHVTDVHAVVHPTARISAKDVARGILAMSHASVGEVQRARVVTRDGELDMPHEAHACPVAHVLRGVPDADAPHHELAADETRLDGQVRSDSVRTADPLLGSAEHLVTADRTRTGPQPSGGGVVVAPTVDGALRSLGRDETRLSADSMHGSAETVGTDVRNASIVLSADSHAVHDLSCGRATAAAPLRAGLPSAVHMGCDNRDVRYHFPCEPPTCAAPIDAPCT